MPNRLLTHDELPAAFAEQARVWREQWRAMTSATRAACRHCWHGVRQMQRCCWCGLTDGPPHGPYAPEGDR